MDEITGTIETKQRYRVLALDGGGIKGTYTAAVLQCLEQLSGKRISEHFDLIAGTSTGGIIAIAIGLGVPLEQILKLYVEQGPQIFPAPTPGLRGKLAGAWRHAWRPKHTQEVLAEALDKVLESRMFGESENRLIIPAFNAVSGEIQLFKTAHCAAYQMDYAKAATEVALATSAAPTFFSAYHDERGAVYLDGGVWANCPAVVALTEATSILNWPIEQVDVLSIGTTCEPFDIRHHQRRAGILGWNKGVIDLFQQAQCSGMLGIARAMTGQRLHRIDAVARPGRFSLDNAREVSDLKALGANCARQNLETVCDQFLSHPVEPFVPCFEVEQHSQRETVNALQGV